MSTDDKAREYLAAGKVKARIVAPDDALFHVTGSDPTSDPYFVKFSKTTGWRCDCPARVAECAHVKACMLITDLQTTEERGLTKFEADPDISKLLDGL